MSPGFAASRVAATWLLALLACSPDGELSVRISPEIHGVGIPQLPPCEFASLDSLFVVDTLARGLEVPWRTAVAPDGRIFITERTGRIVVWEAATGAAREWARLPVFSGGEAGLMGLALHPDFARTRELYVVATFPRFSGFRRFLNRLVSGSGRTTVVNRVLLFRDTEEGGVPVGQIGGDLLSGVLHAGAELGFGPDGLLYVSQGDGMQPSRAPVALDSRGKILRFDVSHADGSWHVFASGFRNVQGFDWNPEDGAMFAVDHGPTGMPKEGGRADNDELNVVREGGRHGWPWASGFEAYEGGTAPIWGWTPAVAPGALAFGAETPRGRELWIGQLKRQALTRLVVKDGDLVCEDWLFLGRFGRIRSVTYDSGGDLYLTTGNHSGHVEPREGDDLLLRLSRAPGRDQS